MEGIVDWMSDYWLISQIFINDIKARTSFILRRWWWYMFCSKPTSCVDFYHLTSSPQTYIWLHFETFYWLRSNPSVFLLLSGASFLNKQQIPISQYLVLTAQSSNPRPAVSEMSKLTMSPPHYITDVVERCIKYLLQKSLRITKK